MHSAAASRLPAGVFGLALALALPAHGATPAVVRLRVDPQTVLAKVPADFLESGYETSAVARQGFFSPGNAAMVQLYRTPGTAGVVRIGGNVSEHTRYEPDGTSAARPQEETTVINRMCEANSFSRGGKPGVSDAFDAALWCLDFLFTLAGEGNGGVNLETDVNQHGWVSHYSPVFRGADGRLHAQPEYYAMLAFSRAGTGEIIKLGCENDAAVHLSAHATRQGTDAVWVTVINKDLTTGAAVSLAVPGAWGSARVYALRAPAAESTAPVTLAGTEVAADGTWTPPAPLPLDPSPDGQWRLGVPHASALLLQLQR